MSIRDQIPCNDDALVRRMISYARSIAPCLDSLTGENEKDAAAIIWGAIQEATARGSRQVASQGVGTASVRYASGGSAQTFFTNDDRDALRAICARHKNSDGAGAGHPVGRFPRTPRHLQAVWPDEEQL